MALEALLINGPAGSGKSLTARLMMEAVLERPAHYLRMRAATDGHTNAVLELKDDGPPALQSTKWASTHEVTYTADRVFETLPEAMRTVRRGDRQAFLVIEADTDSALRHAYPYDYRVFVMPSPRGVHSVFREPRAAATALKQVMQDTAAFASEIFGLFNGAGLDDSIGVVYEKGGATEHRGGHEVEHLRVEESQLRQFLNSPLGAEIASRIQLQPDYHALVEADIVVVNTGVGVIDADFEPCIDRIEKLLSRIRHDARRHSVLYWGDVADLEDPSAKRLFNRLRTLLNL